MHGMDLPSLRYAVTLAEELNFGRAAQRNFVSAQAFGQHIAALERELSSRLFDRTTRRVELTSAGAALVVRARQVLGAVDDLVATARNEPTDDDHLVIGVFGFGLADLGARILETFREVRPDVRIEIRDLTFLDMYDTVRSGEVDVAMLMEIDPVDGVDFHRMIEVPRVCVVPTRSAWADAEWLSEAELAAAQRVPLAVSRTQADWCRVEPEGRRRGAVRTPAAVPEAVAASGAVSVHVAPARDYYPNPGVRYVPCEGEPCKLAVATRTSGSGPLADEFTTVAEAVATSLARVHDAGL